LREITEDATEYVRSTHDKDSPMRETMDKHDALIAAVVKEGNRGI
jgi:hypothetical protein